MLYRKYCPPFSQYSCHSVSNILQWQIFIITHSVIIGKFRGSVQRMVQAVWQTVSNVHPSPLSLHEKNHRILTPSFNIDRWKNSSEACCTFLKGNSPTSEHTYLISFRMMYSAEYARITQSSVFPLSKVNFRYSEITLNWLSPSIGYPAWWAVFHNIIKCWLIVFATLGIVR